MTIDQRTNYFWAKTTREKNPGISVIDHMMNVGYVARSIAESSPDLLRLFHINSQSVGALAALHDLGKISPGFQRKCQAWLKQKGLLDVDQRGRWDAEMEGDHGKVSHAALQKFFAEHGMEGRAAAYLSTVLGGHHGRLNRPNERGFNPQRSIVEERSGIDWDQERKNAAQAVIARFGISLNDILIDDSSPALWWLAGLTSVADWIGSDERYFPAEGGLPPEAIPEVANKCLDEIGLLKPQLVKGLSFRDLFGFPPNGMQSKALSTITDGGLYVIEAPMGMGKTEAALGAAYQLFCTGKANGIYFALPTQATSNRMHLRMREFVKRIAPGAVASKVIHSNSWLLLDDQVSLRPAGTYRGKGDEDAQTGRDWFSSAKRALIAPFGVGTIDQALLGIVAAKHFFVRHFALAGKVVILDEVHSYDLYTGTLINRLIDTLEKLGCTVIVLSATLSGARRNKIVAVETSRSVPASKEPYPSISGRRSGEPFEPVGAEPPEPKNVEVKFEREDTSISLAIESAAKGACVIWVSDTVGRAQNVFTEIRKHSDIKFPIGLLHSRFPFWRREELENEWMDRLGKDNSARCGSILVSTQIVEQSVDLDADLMITELAPTDMLLQRMGRLWRHHRRDRHVPNPRFIIVEERESLEGLRRKEKTEIRTILGEKGLVYDPYVLLRSLEQWKKRKEIVIPTEIRKIIEATYKKRNKEPEVWKNLFDERFASEVGKKFLAVRNSNYWQPELWDDEGLQTRLNDLPTLSMILAGSWSEREIELIDGDRRRLEAGEFELSAARALHRNIVRVPEYHFGKTSAPDIVNRYVHGRCVVGCVDTFGGISTAGLKGDVTLRWDIELGLIIEKREENQ